MAIVCTHFRLALETLCLFGVEDERAFLAGSIYPDSRHLTGVRRIATHGPDCPNDPFAPGLTDFERGWALHLLHDRLSFGPYRCMSPWRGEKIDFGDRIWVNLSAQKVVEDMMSFEALGGASVGLAVLPAPCPPVGEEDARLGKYYHLIGRMYSERPTLDRYKEMWVAYGGQPSVADSINSLAERMMTDSRMASGIGVVFGQVLGKVIEMSRQTRLA